MKKHHWMLLMILLTIICIFIYFYPKLDFSPVATQWGAGSGWRRYYIIENGRIYDELCSTKDPNTPALDAQGNN